MKKVLIIDTKAGNLFSLKAAIERQGFLPTIQTKPDGTLFDAIVIPGQGRFGAVIDTIKENSWDEYLRKSWQDSIPILGICVGMQIFFEGSEEDENIIGLGWLSGKASALNFPKKPMVGWARLTSKFWPNMNVYFVNSFAVRTSDYCIAETTYGEPFCAAIKSGSLIGVQFHPEKSSELGGKIIKQALCGDEAIL